MTISAVPPISMTDVAAELGVAAPLSFNEARVFLLNGKTSGQSVLMSDFAGRSCMHGAGVNGDTGGGSIGYVQNSTGSLSPSTVRGFTISNVIDNSLAGKFVIVINGNHGQNFWFGAIVNGVSMLSQNAAFTIGGSTTAWTYNGLIGLVNGTALNVQIFS